MNVVVILVLTCGLFATIITCALLLRKQNLLSERIMTLESEKGRLAGELSSISTLQAQISSKDKKLEELGDRIVTLEATKADLDQRAKSADQSKKEAIDEMDRHLKSSLDAQAEAMRLRLVEKDRAMVDVLREKDKAIEEQKRLLADAERILSEKFSALSLDSLKSVSEEFLKLANERFDKAGEVSKAELEKRHQAIDELLKPVTETLGKLEKQHVEMEQRRVSAFDSIEKGIKTLSTEADQLANALRKPAVRGAWGEMVLQDILENAGLIKDVHFLRQDTTTNADDERARTDFVIILPQGRYIIIDSKAPLEAFWDGMNSDDEATRTERFQAHARLVRGHVKSLSSKNYWSRYPSSPDFVIMFIPTEGAYQAAITVDNSLILDAQKSRVYISSPMTLMNMIHAIAFVLREERLAQNAQEVQETAAELYRRLTKFIEHIEKLGRNLRLTVDNYNGAVGSLDGRVLPIARKMNSMGVSGGADIPTLNPVDSLPRNVLSVDSGFIPANASIDLSPGEPELLNNTGKIVIESN